jgi:hypothetical protein
MTFELILTAILLPLFVYSYRNRERNKIFIAKIKSITWNQDNRFYRELEPKCPGILAKKANDLIEANIKEMEACHWLSTEFHEAVKKKREERSMLN